MPISPGIRLGPYEILAPIGAGGMGEVYRARDTRLNRDVAVKILPAEVSDDPGRRQRFELEARAVAGLNHPNIVAIYEVGENYIVSEFIDGESLRGAKFGLRKTIDIAVQIASGLAAAHDAGIIHRDLKPGNILLTHDGRAKILDFGLAKVTAPRISATSDETLTVRTEPGIVMGTVGYMSPEQIRGLELDARSDIFSLGAILYEMLTGGRAFQGPSSVDIMSAILKEDVEISESDARFPPSLARIVRRCLEKSPNERFESARDLAFALQAVSPSPGPMGASSAQPAVPTPQFRRRALWVIAALAAAAMLGGIYYLGGRQTTPVSLHFQRKNFPS